MYGKPSSLTPVEYNEQVERVVALKGALARADCVESFDVNIGENGRIRGRVSLRHSEPFFDFNDLLLDHPVKMTGIHSTDRLEETGDGTLEQAVEIRVLLIEE